MNPIFRALNGFGLGARIGERQRIDDPRGWLRAQLQGAAPVLRAPADASPGAITDAIRAFRTAGQADQQARQNARRRLLDIASAEGHAALTERVTSERSFVERLVAFWSNHLCVSVSAKVLVAPLAGSYERDVIRPHVLGRFEDMLLASARHPAMLLYLDNFQSVGPSSQGARAGRGRTGRGLNENYARELLELHTLGVDGGYSQQDVQELAKILSGWTVGGLGSGAAVLRRGARGAAAPAGTNPQATVGFTYQAMLHEPGPKNLIGARYANSGLAEGEHAIRALCRHPSTSRFIARKLVTHFVSDDPPVDAVEAVARVFREADGDLRAVAAALIELPAAWSDSARKFRTPQDWFVSVLRAFNAHEVTTGAMPLLRQIRHPLWAPKAPNGYGDRTEDWADPDSLLNRAELARTIARRVKLRHVDPPALLDVIDVPAGDPLPRFLGDNAIPPDERMALALAGPSFQWR